MPGLFKPITMKQRGISNTTIMVVLILLALAGGYIYLRKRNGKNNLPVIPDNDEDGNNGGGSNLYTDDTFPLSKGSGGDAVETLQEMLADLGGGAGKILPKAGVDGKFGPETAGALKKLGYSQVVTENVMDDIIADVQANEDGGFFSDFSNLLGG